MSRSNRLDAKAGALMKPKPVYWKPRYATRSMRERAWAKADLRREEAMKNAPHRRSFLARLFGR